MNIKLKYINLDYLQSSINNNLFIIKILDVFAGELPKIEKRMKDALLTSNYTELSEIAHKAKSSVAILGMDSEKEAMRNLELDSQNNIKQETYRQRVDDFLQNCKKAIEEIEIIRKAFS